MNGNVKLSVSVLCGCPQRHAVHIVWFPPEAQVSPCLVHTGGGEELAQPLQECAWWYLPGFVRFDTVLTKLPVTVPTSLGNVPWELWLMSGGASTPGLQSLL